MKTPKIIIAHPGEQHARHAVVGLQHRKMLMQYITSFYYKETGFFDYLPEKIKRRLEKELCRRRNDEIDDSLVDMVMPFHELFKTLFARIGVSDSVTQYLIRWRNRRFDRIVADKVFNKQPDGVVVYDSSALRVLSQCKKSNVVGILDQTIGHKTAWNTILEEELLLHPHLFNSTDNPLPTKEAIDMATDEVLVADRILAGSEYTKRTLLNAGVEIDRIKVIPYGANLKLFRPVNTVKVSRKEKFKVLFVGSVGLRKGVHYLLEAVKQLNHPQIELHLVGGLEGNGQWLSKYDGIFKHIPFVTHDRLCRIYQDSDVFVFPSLHEGFGMVLNEAIASGLPIIGTPHTGVPDILKYGKCGYVVPIRDIDELKEKILLLYNDPDLLNEMRNNAIAVSKKFSWEHYGKNIENFINEEIK